MSISEHERKLLLERKRWAWQRVQEAEEEYIKHRAKHEIVTGNLQAAFKEVNRSWDYYNKLPHLEPITKEPK